MRCPTLDKLGPSPPGKSGWPWTEESPQLPNTMPDGSPWPKISIVTPSYNQGQFIEETIRSVLLQGYPNLEYIIIDGGSNDNSVEIIQSYEKHLAYWVSKSDRGQSHAINKGISMCRGDIVAWLNSDDVYHKSAFEKVAKFMWQNGRIMKDIIYGNCDIIDKHGRFKERWYAKPVVRENLIRFWTQNFLIPQPTVFMKASIFRNNLLNELLHYAMDWELYLRLCDYYEFSFFPEIVAQFRFCEGTKSRQGDKYFFDEQLEVSKNYWKLGLMNHIRYTLSWKISPIVSFFRFFPKFLRETLYSLLGEHYYYRLRSIKLRLDQKRRELFRLFTGICG